MIVTLTPNPSVDRALDVAQLEVGEVNRAHDTHVDAGGKGINVSRALVAQGLDTVAVLPVGGRDGDLLVRLLADQHVVARPVGVAGETRTNITLVESTGVTTKVNAPGPTLSPSEVDALLGAVEELLAERPQMLVAAGSLPAGAGEAFFARLTGLAARYRVPVALDTSGVPLARAVRGGGLQVIKPNEDELGELVGRQLVTVGDAVQAARDVLAMGTESVLISLGGHGALLVDAERTWWAGGPALVPASTVGAGDTTLAGYLGAYGDPGDRLVTAVAWGRAAVLLPGTAVPTPEQIDASTVDLVVDPDPTLALKEL